MKCIPIGIPVTLDGIRYRKRADEVSTLGNAQIVRRGRCPCGNFICSRFAWDGRLSWFHRFAWLLHFVFHRHIPICLQRFDEGIQNTARGASLDPLPTFPNLRAHILVWHRMAPPASVAAAQISRFHGRVVTQLAGFSMHRYTTVLQHVTVVGDLQRRGCKLLHQ